MFCTDEVDEKTTIVVGGSLDLPEAITHVEGVIAGQTMIATIEDHHLHHQGTHIMIEGILITEVTLWLCLSC